MPSRGARLRGSARRRSVLMARSRAMATREPGQVRKEAALSGLRHAQRECLSGAGGGVSASKPASTEGARSTFAPRLAAARLLDVVAPEQRRDRHQDDLHVEQQRPVLDVVVVPLDAVLERRLAAQALHLRPAGEAGLDAVAVAVAVDVLLDRAHESRALGTRAHARHVALADVE